MSVMLENSEAAILDRVIQRDAGDWPRAVRRGRLPLSTSAAPKVDFFTNAGFAREVVNSKRSRYVFERNSVGLE